MFFLSAVLWIKSQQLDTVVHQHWKWIEIGETLISVGIYLDYQSTTLLLTVAAISVLVHFFSQTYMKGDEGYVRYFAYLALFTFSMIGLVVSDSILLMYVFWELVGLSSYFLIGFWREKPTAVRAAKKAFLMNRIGDVGFLAAIVALLFSFQTLNIEQLNALLVQRGFESSLVGQLVGIGILLGAFAKSAQLPFSSWLPDAMEGPTPVSALIHAATMVAAGVYLVVRLSFVFLPEVSLGMCFIGTATAFLAACAALTQTDIKKVLAYSTISQLGYMMMAAGMGAKEAAFFHLLTHAFFKAGLFLGAGAIIHALHHVSCDIDAQDIRNMGGLRKQMPITFGTFLICGASLVGLPFFSGFLSKEVILLKTVEFARASDENFFWLIPAFAFSTVLLTAFYMTRLILNVFMGESKYSPQEVGMTMKVPLVILAFFSLAPIYLLSDWATNHSSDHVVMIFSVGVAIVGALAAYFWQKFDLSASGLLVRTVQQYFYFDYLYQMGAKIVLKKAAFFCWIETCFLDTLVRRLALFHVIVAHIFAWIDRCVVDGFVNFFVWIIAQIGYANRWLQNGRLQQYIIVMLFSLIGIIVWLIY